jgi:hypothetical protein
MFGRVSGALPGQSKGGKWRALGVGAALLGCAAGWQTPALAGSDKSADTYAGDYASGIPEGTFIVFNYLGAQHSDAFIGPVGPKSQPGSGANLFTDITRFTYVSKLFDHSFVIEGDFVGAALTGAKFNAQGTGVRKQDENNGFTDPVLHFTYFFIRDLTINRFLGVTNYFYFPAGRSFDNLKAVNVSTAHQFTDVVQLGYTEGLEKFHPALKGFSVDLVPNVSFHTDGDSPVAVAPGVQFDKLVQDTSYDLRAYLRYNFTRGSFIALGYEGSWGGKQTAVGGILQQITGRSLPLSEDQYQRGRIQAQMPLAADLVVAADIFHDFSTKGFFREDIGVEIRVGKIFAPEAPLK